MKASRSSPPWPKVRLALLLAVPAACYTGHTDLPLPQVPLKPVAEDFPGAPAVVTDETATLTYEVMLVGTQNRFVGLLEHRLQIKILNEDGLRFASFKLPIDAFTSVSRVEARSVDPYGNVSYLNDLPAAVQRDEPGWNAPDLKYLVFTVPDATVGGVIDVLYDRAYTAAELVPPWVFGGELPKVRSELAVVFPPDIEIDHTFGRGAAIVDEQPLRRELPGEYTRLVFTLTDIPAFMEEPDGPDITWQAPWVATVVRRGEKGGAKLRMDSWKDVGDLVMKVFKRVGGGAGTGTAQERYTKVRDALLPLAGRGFGVRNPTSASSLMGGAPATTRDAGAVLYNALQGSDVKFYPALVAGPKAPALSQGFPSLYGFSRVVVAVDVKDQVAADASCKEDPISRGLLCSIPDDSYLFLDPLCSYCRYGEVPTELTGSDALIWFPDDPEADPKWVQVPTDPPERNRVLLQYKLALAVDGTIKGQMNGELVGAVSRRVREDLRGDRKKPSEPAPAARDAAVARNLFGPDAALVVTESTLGALTTPEEPLTVAASVKSRAEVMAYEKFRLNPAQVFGPAFPGRWRKNRRTAAILEAPAWFETVASIDLPVGYDVLEDPVTKIITPFAEYAAGFALRERTLNFSRRLVIKKHAIAPEAWPEFRQFLEKVAETERNGIPVFLTERVEEDN